MTSSPITNQSGDAAALSLIGYLVADEYYSTNELTKRRLAELIDKAIIRQHTAAPDVVERVAMALAAEDFRVQPSLKHHEDAGLFAAACWGDYVDAAKAAIAAMGGVRSSQPSDVETPASPASDSDDGGMPQNRKDEGAVVTFGSKASPDKIEDLGKTWQGATKRFVFEWHDSHGVPFSFTIEAHNLPHAQKMLAADCVALGELQDSPSEISVVEELSRIVESALRKEMAGKAYHDFQLESALAVEALRPYLRTTEPVSVSLTGCFDALLSGKDDDWASGRVPLKPVRAILDYLKTQGVQFNVKD